MSAAPAGIFAALGPAPRIILEGLAHRGELAALELVEARNHAAATTVMAMLVAVLTLLGGFAGTFAIAAAVWERPDRGLILAGLTLAYFVGAVGLGWWIARRLKTWRPLSETRRQLGEDGACLEEFLPAHHL